MNLKNTRRKKMKINRYIDHTLLKADKNISDIQQLCDEAVMYDFYAVCINPCWILMAKSILRNKNVKVATVVGFPLGANRMEIKVKETIIAIEDGADEIDMVMNIGEFKSRNYDSVLNEIIGIREIAKGKILKVIIETSLLSKEEKMKVLELVIKSGADFIKTSTGFRTEGANVEDIKLFKKFGDGKIRIKASGGIRDLKTVKKMINAGASRIGTSSSVSIMAELNERS